MSTDWEKYSTAVQTRGRQGRPERFGVLRMIVGKIHEIDGLSVVHFPLPDNRAHTHVYGVESETSGVPDLGHKLKMRLALYDRFKDWEIAPDAPAV